MKQIFLIHGGTTFRNKKDFIDYLKNRKVSIDKKEYWSDSYLDKKIGDKFQIIRPKMPLKENAKYNEWKIHFERFFPLLTEDIILIDTSLGGIFLAKYLSENKFPRRIKSIYLIAPPFDNTLGGEELLGGFKLKSDLSRIERNCKDINLLFSEDDQVVPIEHAKKYTWKIKSAKLFIYKNKNGHFNISEFPELIDLIKS